MEPWRKRLLKLCAEYGYTRVSFTDFSGGRQIKAYYKTEKNAPRIGCWPALWEIARKVGLVTGGGNGRIPDEKNVFYDNTFIRNMAVGGETYGLNPIINKRKRAIYDCSLSRLTTLEKEKEKIEKEIDKYTKRINALGTSGSRKYKPLY